MVVVGEVKEVVERLLNAEQAELPRARNAADDGSGRTSRDAVQTGASAS
jgi:uncharacterized protein YqfA (UPF0365 family)